MAVHVAGEVGEKVLGREESCSNEWDGCAGLRAGLMKGWATAGSLTAGGPVSLAPTSPRAHQRRT